MSGTDAGSPRSRKRGWDFGITGLEAMLGADAEGRRWDLPSLGAGLEGDLGCSPREDCGLDAGRLPLGITGGAGSVIDGA